VDVLVYQEEWMFWPGAKTLTQLPQFEKEAIASSLFVAPTVMAPVARAGE